MKNKASIQFLVACLLGLAGCSPGAGSRLAGGGAAPLPAPVGAAQRAPSAADLSNAPTAGIPTTCPVSQPQNPAFKPPAPYPPEAPYAGEFWYGSTALWTLLPADGTWPGLPHSEAGYTQKVFWWQAGEQPGAASKSGLAVAGRRLDAPAPSLVASSATYGFQEDLGGFILVGVDLPAPGCWEITGSYHAQTLSFVVWVPPE